MPIVCLNSPAHKYVLFLTKSGVTKSYKGLIFISEKVWGPCFKQFGQMKTTTITKSQRKQSEFGTLPEHRDNTENFVDLRCEFLNP